jgi:GNAT superfamily N-acetyltransferase
MTSPFLVRPATADDAPVLARHRAEMFRDMGQLPDELYAPLVDAARAYLARAIPAGEYLGWVAAPAERSEEIIAGAGLQLRPVLPRVQRHAGGATVLAVGSQGLVLNVFTERAWRRRGVAALLMRHVIAGARAAGVSSLVLHASDDGRPLYESLGFVPTNEMRYEGELGATPGASPNEDAG